MKNQRSATNGESALDYYALLGISPDAAQDEIEARYRELVDHMASSAVPPTLRDWATRETALLDEAYAVLSDPERRARLADSPAAVTSEAGSLGRGGAVAGQREQPPSALRALLLGVPWTLAAMGTAIGIVVLVAVFFGGDVLSGIGGGDDSSTAAVADNSGFIPVDQTRVAQLMTQVQADPQDVEALFALGEIYFEAGDWQTSIDWLTKMLAQDPNNISAQTDVGTANFNLGNYDVAKQTWLKALEAAPSDPQLHYNLGFFYANVDPVDFQSAVNEWQTVVQLAPGSSLANTVQVHLDSLAAAAAAATATAAASPEATAAPAGP